MAPEAGATGRAPDDIVDCVVIGGGPAGLSASLNLARALATVALIDTGRPRNAATLRSHGFLSRDGIPPHELRKLGVAELREYPHIRVHERTTVTRVSRADEGSHPFVVELSSRVAGDSVRVAARTVILATGLRETLPQVDGLRSFYGMSVFSCVACDGWELRDRPLALIGETDDLAARALHLSRWTAQLTVFTNGVAELARDEEAQLASQGIGVVRTPIAELTGHRGRLEAVSLADGTSVPVDGGFVRPLWESPIEFLDNRPPIDEEGFVIADAEGRTGIPGLYAAGDLVAPGPQQLIVAAGAGARTAAAVAADLIAGWAPVDSRPARLAELSG
ncbi:NAD(P)/FAD-dependent oxidoreductase [Diaminobutyricibacter tongyongensis]|uniref:NAD(P)/FAD-dependent oxidoreductase n=1 Tax=Leifsonia tongyongensis TaxID=1268043 RepID=A0A6L9XT34_9MICO|nr:NAD(P)/FAD-dependent oxidoreductase [Diaminobutyricibacter tongyongensis]NEN04570.1 NAD(P)/FAD-dependent oxidoreductase [Diaminobutyricibacter tongyongensis]